MYETTMLKDDRVKPNRYVFTVLIGVLGRVGYTKKAFQLFNRVSSVSEYVFSQLSQHLLYVPDTIEPTICTHLKQYLMYRVDPTYVHC